MAGRAGLRQAAQNLQPVDPRQHEIQKQHIRPLLLDHAQDVPALLDQYVFFFYSQRRHTALGYKSPVQYKTELGFP
jgi:hypothetical protein